MVVNVLGDAANPVAAHLAVRPIGVIHPHFGVAALGRTDQNEPVPAHTEPPIRYPPRQLRNIAGKGLRKAIDIDVVVAGALHLGESHSISSIARDKANLPSRRLVGGCHTHSISMGRTTIQFTDFATS